MFSDLIGLLSGKISRSFCQTKLREIEQVTLWLLVNDKTLFISLHETWPGVPETSCLGPWIGGQEPGALLTTK